MNHKNLFVGMSVSLVLFLLATTAVFGEKCKQVVVHHVDVGPILLGPENCSGYDLCVTSKISGTFNGTITEAGNFVDTYYLVDAAYAYTMHGVIETKQGEIFFVERSIADYEAPDGFGVHINVLGGSGRYEGATGWMAYFGNFEGTFNRFGGEVCWPEED